MKFTVFVQNTINTVKNFKHNLHFHAKKDSNVCVIHVCLE